MLQIWFLTFFGEAPSQNKFEKNIFVKFTEESPKIVDNFYGSDIEIHCLEVCEIPFLKIE